MDLVTHKLFVTRDIVFEEYVFSFAETSTSKSPANFLNLGTGIIDHGDTDLYGRFS